jgi:hypothetical protein
MSDMLRSQRRLVACGLVLAAVLLHVNLCEWKFRSVARPYDGTARRYRQQPIGGWSNESTLYRGLVSDTDVDLADAVVFGIVAPMGLMMTLAYLWMGWRREARVRRGLCAACGYDLRGREAGPCPECGAGGAR